MKKKYLALLVLALTLLLSGGIWIWGGKISLPDVSLGVIVTDRSNAQIGEILSSDGGRYIPVSSDEIPHILTRGLIALEDQNFENHFGVSPTALARSVIQNTKIYFGLSSGGYQGGSTLTMGLARNLLGINRARGFSEKIEEVLYAIRIEGHLSKAEILNEYLNRVHFSRLVTGIGAASETYFGKSLKNLTDAESLGLLTLIKNPVAYDPIREPEAFLERYSLVVEVLKKEGVLSEDASQIVLAERLDWIRPKSELPYVIDFLKSEKNLSEPSQTLSQDEQKFLSEKLTKGGELQTTIDFGLTKRIGDIADSVRTSLQYRNVSDYGILVVDRKTLEVRSLIGGVNYGSSNAGQVNSVFAERQIGSTVKPFTYLLGIVDHGHHMQDAILDEPVSYLTSDGNPYEPKNYSLRYRGSITLAEALAGSVNIPAVKMAEEVGVGRLLEFLRSLQIHSLRDSADHYGLALTLGVGEVSLWELLRAYTIFAHNGELCDFSILTRADVKAPNCQPIVDQTAISEIVSALSNNQYKSEEFPLGSALDFGVGHVFVKTGTSRNFRDNYAIGFTKNYMIGVWTGNKDGSNMRGVSGASGAGEIFSAVVKELQEENLSLGSQEISPKLNWNTSSNTSAGAQNPGESNSSQKKDLPLTITSPLPEARYHPDSDIPANRQNISVKYWSTKKYDQVKIQLKQLDGTYSASLVDGIIPIGKLTPGTYQVRLQGFIGGELSGEESVRFIVE